ncbi:MAG: tetratricopeptide repeat protein, partial [Promethearchaeota archaeon]
MLLINNYFTDDQLNVYNEILLKIYQKYLKDKKFVLKDYYQEIKEIHALNQAPKEPKIQISEYYSYTAALEDFQAGVRLFKTKNFDQAYNILRKVLLKFEQENNKNLIMEVLYIIGSLFAQQKRFKVAKEYFKRLKKLANEMQHKKYSEISIFMQGFCAYKNENYTSAVKKFEKINISKAQFINKLQFYTIYGRILVNHEKYEEALQAFSKALIINTEMKLSDTLKKQQSQILYELGVINYRIAAKNLKCSGINQQNNYQSYLQAAINYFKRAIKLLINLNEYNTLIQIYQLIGNIYDFLNKKQNSLKYYEKALKIAFESNNLDKQIKIINRIVQ